MAYWLLTHLLSFPHLEMQSHLKRAYLARLFSVVKYGSMSIWIFVTGFFLQHAKHLNIKFACCICFKITEHRDIRDSRWYCNQWLEQFGAFYQEMETVLSFRIFFKNRVGLKFVRWWCKLLKRNLQFKKIMSDVSPFSWFSSFGSSFSKNSRYFVWAKRFDSTRHRN